MWKAWTASGDGTSRKGTSVGSHFATFPPVPFQQNINSITPGVPSRQFLASTREVSHKTSTQLENWLTLCDDIATINNNSPSGHKNPITVDEIVQKITGYSGDHASDQKLLAREFCRLKQKAVVRAQGMEAMASKPAKEVEGALVEKFMKILEDVGGWEGWGKLSGEDQIQEIEGLIEDVGCRFGEQGLAELPESEQRIKRLFKWSGCAMHKDLNTFKAGAASLAKFWKGERSGGPVKLLSRGQEEALTNQDGVEDCGDGGAVKLASLIGALVNNRDEGKGCFEQFRTYTHDCFGKLTTFPDTSNVRYQCYGDAGTEIIQHPDLYTGFIHQRGTMKKGAAGPNHMEANILKGLGDPKTMTEMAVLALYNESTSKPYAMEVRGSINEHKNALDLGPLHMDLANHCNRMANNPELLLGDNTSHITGAFHETPWNQAVVDHIRSIRDRLPCLDRALAAFFKGAYEKWPAFMEEFEPGSGTSQMTVEEKALAFRSPTNDHNEGACAMWKGWSRRAPNMTTHQINSRLQVQLNESGLLEFSHNLGEGDRAFTRAKARKIDAAKLPLKERQAQAAADHETVEEEQKGAERRERLREERKVKASELIQNPDFEPALSLDEFQSKPEKARTVKFLRQELIWLRVVDGDKDVPSGLFTSTKKEKLEKLVVGGLEQRQKMVRDEVAKAGGTMLKFSHQQTQADNQMDVDAVLLSDAQ